MLIVLMAQRHTHSSKPSPFFGARMSDTKRYSLSLSRWHTIAERLSTLADARAKEALNTIGNTNVSFVLDTEQVEALRVRGVEATRLVALARLGFKTVAFIRDNLARANAETGVSGLLAQTAGVRRELKLVRSISEVDVTLRTSLDKVNARLEGQQGERSLSSRMNLHGSIPVNIVDNREVAKAKEEITQLELSLALLSDQVNDLNRKTIEIALPEVLAKEVGL